MIHRHLTPSLGRSFFLFGPRSTGKSTLLKQLLPESKAFWVDLLDTDTEKKLMRSPSSLSQYLDSEYEQANRREWVVIDEVHKIPELLSVAQQYIQSKKFKFALTGSSARKLKRGGANLLGGRASWYELYSLTSLELGKSFNLKTALTYGGLPELFELNDDDRIRFLKSYATTYLKEEIVAEQLVRKVQPFRNFLELVAMQNAQIINYSRFAKDCGVETSTIQDYFEILKDTLIGFELSPFHESIRQRQRKNPKFYFFDVGVTRALSSEIENKVIPRTYVYGKLFEQFFITEIHKLIKCREKDWKLSYLASKDNKEIDLIIEKSKMDRIAVEIKSTDNIDEVGVKSFEGLAIDIPHCTLIYVSQDKSSRKIGSVQCLHWEEAIKKIFELGLVKE